MIGLGNVDCECCGCDAWNEPYGAHYVHIFPWISLKLHIPTPLMDPQSLPPSMDNRDDNPFVGTPTLSNQFACFYVGVIDGSSQFRKYEGDWLFERPQRSTPKVTCQCTIVVDSTPSPTPQGRAVPHLVKLMRFTENGELVVQFEWDDNKGEYCKSGPYKGVKTDSFSTWIAERLYFGLTAPDSITMQVFGATGLGQGLGTQSCIECGSFNGTYTLLRNSRVDDYRILLDGYSCPQYSTVTVCAPAEYPGYPTWRRAASYVPVLFRSGMRYYFNGQEMASSAQIPDGFTGSASECSDLHILQDAPRVYFWIGEVGVQGIGAGVSLTYSANAIKQCTSKDAYPWQPGIDSQYIDYQTPSTTNGFGFTAVTCNRTSRYLITGD